MNAINDVNDMNENTQILLHYPHGYMKFVTV